MPSINERMRAAGIQSTNGDPGYSIAHMLSWAERELDKMEAKNDWYLKNYALPLVEDMEKGETE